MPTKEELEELYAKSAELSSLKQTISESALSKYFPKKGMSLHDKIILAIANIHYLIENQSEYAKQQSIEFMKYVDAFYSQQVSSTEYDKMYSQFIEQQTKE